MARPCSFPHSIKEQGNELSLHFNSSRLEMKSAAHYSQSVGRWWCVCVGGEGGES